MIKNQKKILIKKSRLNQQVKEINEAIPDELSSHKFTVDFVGYALAQYKDKFFENKQLKDSEICRNFLQSCIIPRLKISPWDASFCAKLMMKFHAINIPRYALALHLDYIFKYSFQILSTLTELESRNFGIFMNEMLKSINCWHASKSKFTEEFANSTSYNISLRKSSNVKINEDEDEEETSKPSTSHKDSTSKEDTRMEHENFRRICFKWHQCLTKAVLGALNSDSSFLMRSALMFLQEIVQFYPLVANFGADIEHKIKNIILNEKDKRKDIFTLATAYSGILLKFKSKWQSEDHFCLKSSNQSSSSSDKSSKRYSLGYNLNINFNFGSYFLHLS